MINLSQPSTSDLLNGKSLPRYEVLLRLVELGYNANWLLTGHGPMMLADTTKLSYELPSRLAGVAEKLHKYPELCATFADAITLNEKLEAAQNELKSKLKYSRPKKQ